MILLMIILILDYLRFFYKKKLRIAKHIVYWKVEKVLRFFKSWHLVDQLSLKQLTMKTLALIAITTSERGQTLYLMNIKKMHISDNRFSFIMTNKLKTTKRALKPKIVKCVNCSDPTLDVCAYVKSYMLETSKFRNENHNDLFLSWATKKPVTKVSLARWLKTIFSLS